MGILVKNPGSNQITRSADQPHEASPRRDTIPAQLERDFYRDTFPRQIPSPAISPVNIETPIRPWDPPRKLVKAIRDYQHWKALANGKNRILRPVALCLSKIAVIRHRFWQVANSCEIPINTKLGHSFNLVHATGVIIHSQANIGHGVTLLGRNTITANVTVGDKVEVGTGAVIIGKTGRPVTIGCGAVIGANAVVVKDVPARSVVAGNPARILRFLDEPTK